MVHEMSAWCTFTEGHKNEYSFRKGTLREKWRAWLACRNKEFTCARFYVEK